MYLIQVIFELIISQYVAENKEFNDTSYHIICGYFYRMN